MAACGNVSDVYGAWQSGSLGKGAAVPVIGQLWKEIWFPGPQAWWSGVGGGCVRRPLGRRTGQSGFSTGLSQTLPAIAPLPNLVSTDIFLGSICLQDPFAPSQSGLGAPAYAPSALDYHHRVYVPSPIHHSGRWRPCIDGLEGVTFVWCLSPESLGGPRWAYSLWHPQCPSSARCLGQICAEIE